MAGDSKFPGIVAAGLDGDGRLVGYPMDWLASTMRCTIPELAVSLEKFVKSDRVKIGGTKDAPIIQITSWKRYQSEYLRQVAPFTGKNTHKSSPQLSKQTSVSSLHPLAPEVEGEREVEGEDSPLPPASGGFQDVAFHGGTLRIHRGRHQRVITGRDKSVLQGARVDEAKAHFEAKGFRCEIVKA